MNLKTKLALSLSAILLLSILGVSVFNYRVSREAVRSEILDSGLPLTRDTIYSEIHGALMEPLFVSSLMANDTFLKDWAVQGEQHPQVPEWRQGQIRLLLDLLRLGPDHALLSLQRRVQAHLPQGSP